METLEEISINVNGKLVSKINFNLSKNLEELRFHLEKNIPNDLRFLKDGKILEKEKEKKIIIANIIDKSHSINLTQDYFEVFFDNKRITKKVNLTKYFSLSTLIQLYKNEFPEVFDIKCEPNVIIRIKQPFDDEDLQINDFLIDNSIYVFSTKRSSKNKITFKNNKFGYFLKINGNLTFEDIKWQNIEIFYTLLLNNEYDKYLNESKYEIRRKNTIEEYEKSKNTINFNPNKLEKLISDNNTNQNVIFDYLMILKKNKDTKFEENLKKYSFLFDARNLRKLDDRFNNKIFENYYDEKTNLTKFFENVINGYYDQYEDINAIISEIDYRDNIQIEIATPFINCFSKEKYINCPIPISDNNLLFHYLRVKFLQFLQNAFQFKVTFQTFCKILLQTINKMTTENDPKMKSKLLLEIICMISIYGFHAEEKELVLNYYSHTQRIQYDYYYYPMIFFSYIKNILFDYYRMIGNSNCLSTALIEYKMIINHNSEKPAELDIKNSIDYLIRNTIFIPFFSKNDWGITLPAFNISFINIDIFPIEKNNTYPDYSFLFFFIKYIISFIHEPIGHNLKIYESFNNNLQTPFDTPRIIENNKEKVYEGGFLMEDLLINSIKNLNIEHVLFLLNENNWALDHKNFLARLKEIKEPKLEKCISLIETGTMNKKLFCLFKINKKSIKNAIKNKTVLDTQYDSRFNNEIRTTSMEEKFRSNKEKIKEKDNGKIGRTYRTHSFY